tara:strand:+ start:182 stop:391 length:210 start_codon:yes stop_codon:yes gene_type:complete
MNCTAGAKQMINQRRISKKSLKKGFTAIFSKKTTTIKCWDKFLGDHTIQGHNQIGWKCNITGKITKLDK